MPKWVLDVVVILPLLLNHVPWAWWWWPLAWQHLSPKHLMDPFHSNGSILINGSNSMVNWAMWYPKDEDGLGVEFAEAGLDR